MSESSASRHPAAGATNPTTPATGTIVVLFDGICNLCNGAVQFLLRRDRQRRFRFAALQSATGRRLLQQHGLAADGLATIVVLEEGHLRLRSDAALLLARRLPWPWPLWTVFLVCPRPLRDALYDFVARNRYRWFGRRESCLLPTPETADRFLD